MKPKKTSELIQFTANPWWYTVRGLTMIGLGGLITALSIVSPEVYMLGKHASWIPAIGLIILFVGIFRCLDGIASETAQGYLFNMQSGIMDVVVGFILLFSNDVINSVNLLIVCYLFTQGLYRNLLLSVGEIRNPLANRITGVVSILLGSMIWIDWPTALWFISFSLGIDISFRGWVLIVMASSLKNEPIKD